MRFIKIILFITLLASLGVALFPAEQTHASSVFIPETRSPIITFAANTNGVPASDSYTFDLSQYPELSDNLDYQVVIGYYFEVGGQSIPYAVPVETAGIRLSMPVTTNTACLPWSLGTSADPCNNVSGPPSERASHWFYVSSRYENKRLTINYTWNTNHWAPNKEWVNFFFIFGGNSYNYFSPPTLTFTADSVNLPYGDATNLRWSSSNTLGCVASGAWGGSRPLQGAESTGPLTSSKSYTMTCIGQSGTIEKRVDVNVSPPAPPSVSLSASPTSIRLGQSSAISWNVSGTNVSCSASGSWSGGKPILGTENVTPPSVGNHAYTLNCSGPGGSDSKSRNVTVSDPLPSADIKANGSDGPINIDYNQSANISWSSVYSQFPQYGGSCSVSKNGAGFASGTSGSQPTGPLFGTVTYSISCGGTLGQASDSATINVAAPTLSVRFPSILLLLPARLQTTPPRLQQIPAEPR